MIFQTESQGKCRDAASWPAVKSPRRRSREQALQQVPGGREERSVVEGVAPHVAGVRRAAPQHVRVLLLVEPEPLLLQVGLLALAGAFEASRADELHDRLQLPVVEPDAVVPADVHDHPGETGEVLPVHEATTGRAGPIALGPWRTRRGCGKARAQDDRLLLPLGADALEG